MSKLEERRRIAELARLRRPDYTKRRKKVAKELGINVRNLDTKVQFHRKAVASVIKRARRRKQRSRTEWGDIPNALALIQEKLGVGPGATREHLFKAWESRKVQLQFWRSGHWAYTKPFPLKWLEGATIANDQLINAAGSDLETDQWKIRTNLSELRDYLDKLIGKSAVKAAPVELPAPASPPAPVTPPAPEPAVVNNGNQPKKQVKLETYTNRQDTHYDKTGEWFSRKEDINWARVDNYSVDRVRGELRRSYKANLSPEKRKNFETHGRRATPK